MMTQELVDKGLSNPFSTGGGGTTFEQLVGASYLVSLVAGDIPRGLDWGIIESVQFQQRWARYLLDDIIITTTDGNKKRKLALQVKHKLGFSESDDVFVKVIKDCWDTFSGSLGGTFDKELDRIGIGVGVYQAKLDHHFKPLLEIARTSKNSDEFFKKISLSSFSSIEKGDYLKILKNLLEKAKSDITNEEIWQFLKCLVVIHFDLESEGSRDTIISWNRLLDVLKERNSSQAILLFDHLTSIVAKYSRMAGHIDYKVLTAEITGVALKDRPEFTADLRNLRSHSDIVLDSIRDTIGDVVQLPRIELIEEISRDINEKEIIVISGEPMIGKSVILKLLASRLRSEGEIICFSTERFSGTNFDEFLHNINVQNNFLSILSAIGNCPNRCILIDGLEKAINEDKRRILNDLIITVRRYNKSLTNNGYSHYPWRIILTSRAFGAKNFLSHLETRCNFIDNSIKIIDIKPLTKPELSEVAEQLPQLKEIIKGEYLSEILSRPLVLDILTLPNICWPSASLPPKLTETWLLEWYWKEIVRLAEGVRSGEGDPDRREQLMIRTAKSLLNESKPLAIDDNIDPDALAGLISDRLLIKENNSIKFSHDVLEDWTFVVILKEQKANISNYLLQNKESLRFMRPFELFSVRFLDFERSPEDWLKLLSDVEAKTELSPRWYESALYAVICSPLVEEILAVLQSYMLENGGVLLSKFIYTMRRICVEVDPIVYKLFKGLSIEEIGKYTAYLTIPIKDKWIPIIQIVIQNFKDLNDECFYEFSFISGTWMSKTENNYRFRKEIALLSMRLLNLRFLSDRCIMASSLPYEKFEKTRLNLIESVLWASDLNPRLASYFAIRYCINNEENLYDFRKVILEDTGWVPICKYLPHLAIELIFKLLYDEISLNDHVGTLWDPPTYLEGPFYGLLNLHPDRGLELIHKIANHATQCWKIKEESEWGRKPIAQRIRIGNRYIEVWGDASVYRWFRYPSNAPNAITCSLMALEHWMIEQVKKSIDPIKLIETTLLSSISASVVGVCVSAALTNYIKGCYAIMPVLENPAFWFMDTARLNSDLSAESTITLFSSYFGIGSKRKASYKLLLADSKQSFRRTNLMSFIIPIIFGSESSVYLQDMIRSFPDNVPFFFEDQRSDIEYIEEKSETLRIWASFSERGNYEFIKNDDLNIIQYRAPPEIDKIRENSLQEFGNYTKGLSLLHWSQNLLDNDSIEPEFSLETAMEYAQNLVTQDNPQYRPKSFLEPSEQIAEAIAAFAAAMVVRKRQWVKEHSYCVWCKEQLIIASKRPEPLDMIADSDSKLKWDYRISAARALPILLSQDYKDKRLHKAILRIAKHKNHEVRDYLFDSLKHLWPCNQSLVWRCINIVIHESKTSAIDRRMRYTYQKDVDPLKVRAIIADNIYPKSLSNIMPDEIDTHILKSVLYCIPQNKDILSLIHMKKFKDLFESLISFTINSYLFHQKDMGIYNEWDFNTWNDLIFISLSNIILRVPEDSIRLLNLILASWEKAPSILEHFLRQLILVGSASDLEDSLTNIWPEICKNVLNSERCKRLNYHDMEDILGLLIFIDPSGAIKWETKEWQPVYELANSIDQWVKAVGSNPLCFRSLIKFLNGIGFGLLIGYGIRWIYECIFNTENKIKLLDTHGSITLLDELINNAWIKYNESLKEDKLIFNEYVYILDIVSHYGGPLSINIQKSLR
ncbi:MAG: hypothetical protein PHQ34_08380 [Methanothrix sp.]|nr:hypothetical protein [Methanothrix sp.]